jgi:cysteine desulfurase
MAYLDHNATSPLRPEACAAIERALAVSANPSSVHASGRASRALVEEARADVASLVGARAQDVVFTGSGTEANVLALSGAIHGAAEAGQRITRLFVSAIEHDSILATASALAERNAGLRLKQISVGRDGIVQVEELRRNLREGKGRALIAVMAANNETGAVQPLEQISALARESEALLHVDAIQMCGRSGIDFAGSGFDYMSLSAHKIGGPQGVGALVAREYAPLAPQLFGGAQERGRRAGTENVAGIAGFGAAARVLRGKGAEEAARVTGLRDRFEAALKGVADNAIIFAFDAVRLGNTSNFCISGIAAETALMALDLDGVMVSSGSACSSGRVRPSHVLSAMGVPDDIARGALRISLGWNSTDADVDGAISSLSNLRARVLARAA